ncbi:MAG: PepSY domain-containing protein [Synergistaceae bacterium]|jgi:uncharacterized membrane protein YkoI|nr:PepSY domain-containing protein [Synergistaceae bacterium]
MSQVRNFMFVISFFLVFSVQAAASAAYIGGTEAKSIAFQHAGLSEKEISAVSVKQYEKRGIRLYDITFSGGGVKYNYEIDAVSGEIVEYERRNEGRAIQRTDDSSQGYIGFEKAKSIALVHANVPENEIRKYEAELDRHHGGRAVYEIEFDHDRTEYEYDIDAETGEIVRWESEYD